MSRKKLGEILVDSNLLNEEQVQQALRIQEKRGGKLGEIFVNLGLVDEKTIADIVSQQRDFKRIELNIRDIDRSLLHLIPTDVCRKYRIIPFGIENDKLVVAMDDPLNYFALDIVEFVSNYKVMPAIAEPSKIEEILDALFGKQDKTPHDEKKSKVVSVFKTPEVNIPLLDATDETVVRDVDNIFYSALEAKATDIHIDPTPGFSRIRFRINSVLQDKFKVQQENHDKILARIKVMANLDIYKTEAPQTGSFNVPFKGKRALIKANILPTITGESVALKIVSENVEQTTIEQLGLTPHELAIVIENIFKPGGLIIVCGPAGIGKTTSVYAILQKIFGNEKKVFTIEKHVEQPLDFASQVQLDPRRGLGYTSALKMALAMDPDIIMIDEITDAEIARLAIRAAYTGHTVITTLYTRDTFESIIRLVDFGIEPFIVADAINLVISQRLVRTLCQSCKEPTKLNDGRIVYRPGECMKCNFTGYYGSTGIFELLQGQFITRIALAGKPSVEELAVRLREAGVESLWHKGVKKVLAGETSLTEIVRTIPKMPWD